MKKIARELSLIAESLVSNRVAGRGGKFALFTRDGKDVYGSLAIEFKDIVYLDDLSSMIKEVEGDIDKTRKYFGFGDAPFPASINVHRNNMIGKPIVIKTMIAFADDLDERDFYDYVAKLDYKRA